MAVLATGKATARLGGVLTAGAAGRGAEATGRLFTAGVETGAATAVGTGVEVATTVEGVEGTDSLLAFWSLLLTTGVAIGTAVLLATGDATGDATGTAAGTGEGSAHPRP